MERKSWMGWIWVGLSVLGAAEFNLAGEVSKAQAVEDPAAIFERLKKLNGEWQGTVESKQGPAATVLYRLTANGKTLMETLFPGTDHEMVSMYHLDGKDLVVSHYCAMGNQPRMKLTSASLAQLVFDFAAAPTSTRRKTCTFTQESSSSSTTIIWRPSGPSSRERSKSVATSSSWRDAISEA